MSLVPEQAAFLRDVCKLIQYASDHGFVVTGGELERKTEMQQIYMQTGRSKTMDSMHLQRCAIDLNFFREQNGTLKLTYDVAELAAVGAYWESLDARNRWGGNWNSFKDVPHFERNLKAARVDTVFPTTTSTAQAAPPPPAPDATLAGSAIDREVHGAPAFGPQLAKGSNNTRAVALLQTLLNRLGLLPSVDGIFGEGTERAIRQFQGKNGLKVDGSVGDKTWTALIAQAPEVFSELSSRWIGEPDFDAAAKRLQCDGAAVRAVYEVESGGSGFMGLKPLILFEGHVFWQRLQAHGQDPRSLCHGNEDILYEKWNTAFYKRGLAEWTRLERAITLHREAALESASWGLFQIMGHHWKSLGYESLDQFITAMESHEREQLEAFCRFVERNSFKGKKLVQYLREHDWTGFAEGYNGSGYRRNGYDERLARSWG